MDELEIQMYGAITPYAFYSDEISAAQVSAALRRRPNADVVRVRLHSPGGSPFEAVAIRSQLESHPGRKVIQIDGIAASAASVVAAAEGAEVEIAEGGFVMIHNASSRASGGRQDMASEAALLASIDEQTAQLYSKRTKLPVERVRKMMDATTWIPAQEAVRLGFADRVISRRADIAQSFDLSSYPNVPAQLVRGNLTQAAEEQYGDRMNKEIRQRLGLSETASDAEVMQALNSQLSSQRATAPAPAAPVAPVAPAPGVIDLQAVQQMVTQAVTGALSAHTASQAHKDAVNAAVERFIAEGKILPAQRAAAIAACGETAQSLSAVVQYWTDAPRVVPQAQKLGALPGAGNGGFAPSARLQKMMADSGVSLDHVRQGMALDTMHEAVQ